MLQQNPEKELWNKSIRYLARREYTRSELRAKLSDVAEEYIDSVLDALEQAGYLSDYRFTLGFVRARINQGHGLKRIEFDLQKKGVNTSLMHDAIEELSVDWYVMALEVYKKKYNASLGASDYKEKSKRVRFMSQRGFAMDEIMHAIDCCERDSSEFS